MPRGNRTGPRGDGPMSGRGAGYCAGNDRPGFASSGMGYGRGFGRGQAQGGYGQGRGRGFGRGQGYGPGFREPDPYYSRTVPVYKEPSPDEEKQYLEDVVKDLEAELENVKTRIKSIEAKPQSNVNHTVLHDELAKKE